MEEQKTDTLAKKLAKKKDDNLKKIAETMTVKICKLAEKSYSDSVIIFKFKRSGILFLKPVKMKYSTLIIQKMRKNRKQHTKIKAKVKKTENDLDSEEIFIEPETVEYTEEEKLYMEIVRAFNSVETTIESNGELYSEQRVVLTKVKKMLERQDFKVDLDKKGFYISWWGNQEEEEKEDQEEQEDIQEIVEEGEEEENNFS